MPWTAAHESALTRELRGRYEEGTWFNRKYLQVGRKLKSPAEVRAQLGLDPSRKTAVIFSHVLWDATFFYGENLFDDYEQWLVETVKVACTNRAVNWVIKLHPDYVWKMKLLGRAAGPRDLLALRAEVGQLPEHVKILTPEADISTWSLLSVTDYCITARGTVGIESACLGLPVITAGTGRYSGLGFTVDSASRESYVDKLRNLHEIPPLTPEQTRLAKQHAYALFRLRPWSCQMFELVQVPMAQLGHPLDHNTVVRAHSLQDVAGASDLGAFAEWASHSSDEVFLLPDPLSQGALAQGERHREPLSLASRSS